MEGAPPQDSIGEFEEKKMPCLSLTHHLKRQEKNMSFCTCYLEFFFVESSCLGTNSTGQNMTKQTDMAARKWKDLTKIASISG